MNKFSYILIALVSVFTFIKADAQKQDLKLKLEKGHEYIQHLSSRSDILQDYNGTEMNMEMLIESDISYTVTEITDGNYTMSVKYTVMNMTMSTPMGSSDFSSENEDEGDIVSSLLKEMINKPFTIIMSKTGEVVEVKELESMYEGISNKLSTLPAQQQQQMESQLKQAFGEEAFKGNIEMAMSIFPEKKVSVGDSWTEKTNIKTGMPASVVSTYKLSEVTADYILINGEADLKSQTDDYIEANGFPVKYDLAGKIVSEIRLDPDTRWIIKANVEQNIKGDIYIKPNLRIEEGTKVPMEVRNEIVIEGR